MNIKIKAKYPVYDWRGNSSDGICPECYGPLIAIKAEVNNEQ